MSFVDEFWFSRGRLVLEIQCFIGSDGSSVARIQNFPFVDRAASGFRGQQGFETMASCSNDNFFHNYNLPSCNDI